MAFAIILGALCVVFVQGTPECNSGRWGVADHVDDLEERVSALESYKSQGGWELLFSSKNGTGINVLSVWEGGRVINARCPHADIYRSPLVEDIFQRRRIADLIKISVLVRQKEVAFWIFDGRRATDSTWMSKETLLASSSGLMLGKTFNFFSPTGDDNRKRRFFISEQYGECWQNKGWLVAVEPGEWSTCAWTKRAQKPFFLYCPEKESCFFDHAPMADTLMISAKLV